MQEIVDYFSIVCILVGTFDFITHDGDCSFCYTTCFIICSIFKVANLVGKKILIGLQKLFHAHSLAVGSQ